jgi:DNA-binding NarL/FixJ family response regulator
MLTTFEGDVEIQRALAAAARGYLLKNMPPKELVEAIRQVHAGRKRIPSEIAAQLAEHIADERLTAITCDQALSAAPDRDEGAVDTIV